VVGQVSDLPFAGLNDFYFGLLGQHHFPGSGQHGKTGCPNALTHVQGNGDAQDYTQRNIKRTEMDLGPS
jgi:hypothetical protein